MERWPSWSKALASKASRRQTRLVSSNLTLSAIDNRELMQRGEMAELDEGARLESE